MGVSAANKKIAAGNALKMGALNKKIAAAKKAANVAQVKATKAAADAKKKVAQVKKSSAKAVAEVKKASAKKVTAAKVATATAKTAASAKSAASSAKAVAVKNNTTKTTAKTTLAAHTLIKGVNKDKTLTLFNGFLGFKIPDPKNTKVVNDLKAYWNGYDGKTGCKGK